MPVFSRRRSGCWKGRVGNPTVSAPKINRERGGEKVRNNFAEIFDRQQKNTEMLVFPYFRKPSVQTGFIGFREVMRGVPVPDYGLEITR